MRVERADTSYDPHRMRAWRRSSKARARSEAEARSAALPTGFPPPNPFAPLAWPPPPWPPAPVDALLVEPDPELLAVAPEIAAAPPPSEPPYEAASAPPEPARLSAETEPTTGRAFEPEPATHGAPMLITADAHAELLRLFGVVTNMCDHVIEYIESDRAERRMMLETLATLGRTISESAATLAPRLESARQTVEARVLDRPQPRERVVGGSMPAGPEPVIDLRSGPATAVPAPVGAPDGNPTGHSSPPPPTASAHAVPATEARPSTTTTTVMTTEIAVEVRGRFGDRWVDGFEICEVMETPEGHRYRLRRHRDGVVLPELFDATSIRHVETFDQLAATNGTHAHRGNAPNDGRDANVTDATGYAAPSVNGASTHWSRS
jgi:hypothetical protein